MSLFAGIFSLGHGQDAEPPPVAACRSIVRSISRSGDPVSEYSTNRFFLAKIDIGAFPEKAYWESAPSFVATLTGHPYLRAANVPQQSRQAGLKKLCENIQNAEPGVLAHCDGSFALCCYDALGGSLVLATDRLGVRPLYYHIGKQHLCFATSLRVLESLDLVPRTMNVEAVAQLATLGYPLGDRTPFDQVKILEDGQLLRAVDGRIAILPYSRLDDIPPFHGPQQDFDRLFYDAFIAAVAVRAGDADAVVSLLSGGLDTRCIVTALTHLEKDVYTLTFETPGPDSHIARAYAEVLDTHHQQQPLRAGEGEMELARRIKDVQWPTAPVTLNPKLVFSGDGGSVGVGFVYLDARMIQSARQGDLESLAEALVGSSLPLRFLKRDVAKELRATLVRSVQKEIARNRSADRGRNIHLFFMRNDQRRHLHRLFEDIDEYRVEFLTPFFHGALIDLLLSAPLDGFLRHAFYHGWLKQFPKEVFAVPWQTYPKHLPCDVPGEQLGRSQWDKTRRERFAASRSGFDECLGYLFSAAFPAPIMDRLKVSAALLAHATRLHNCAYIFRLCNKFAKYYSQCNGNLTWPSESGVGAAERSSRYNALPV